MAILQVYSDDTSASDNTLKITVTISGTPEHCERYRNLIDKIILNGKKGADFKGIHALNINDDNWNSTGKIAENILATLKSFIDSGELKAMILLQGKENFDANAGYLKDLFKKQILSEKSSIHHSFKSLDISDYPALYHRIDQLCTFFKLRDRLGREGDEFELFPDSEGKILRYKEAEFKLAGTLPIESNFHFYEIIKILGNALMKMTATLPGWPSINQSITKFDPKKWSDDTIVQTCDIIANFFLNHLRYKTGITEKKYEYKSLALEKIIDFNMNINKEFIRLDTSGKDITCLRKELFATLSLEKTIDKMKKITINDVPEVSGFFQPFRNKINCLVHDIDAKSGEPLNNFSAVPAYDQWRTIEISGKTFYVMLDHFMEEILEGDLFEKATARFPDAFGSKDPESVISALWECSNYDKSMQDFKSFLRQGSYFAIADGDGKTLKIPLFRQIEDGRSDFSGGILHTLKHFQVLGKAVTTSSQAHEFSQQTLIDICEAFFFLNPEPANVKAREIGTKVVSDFDLSYEFKSNGESYNMKVRYGGICDLYFLGTVHRV